MCEPTAQAYAGNDRYDDNGIGAADRLLRHIRSPVQIARCALNGHVVSDRAFVHKPAEPGTSVDLECLLVADGLAPDHRYGLMPSTFALVAITANDAREIAGGVAWTPKPEEPGLPGAAGAANHWHGEVIGAINGAQSRALRDRAVMIRSDLHLVPAA